jgi:hypothetical protein
MSTASTEVSEHCAVTGVESGALGDGRSKVKSCLVLAGGRSIGCILVWTVARWSMTSDLSRHTAQNNPSRASSFTLAQRPEVITLPSPHPTRRSLRLHLTSSSAADVAH